MKWLPFWDVICGRRWCEIHSQIRQALLVTRTKFQGIWVLLKNLIRVYIWQVFFTFLSCSPIPPPMKLPQLPKVAHRARKKTSWHLRKIDQTQHKKSPVIRQNGESQNGCYKRTKHVKFSKKTNTRVLLPLTST